MGMIQAQLEEKESTVNCIAKIFKESDTDRSGMITISEFSTLLQIPEVVSYLNAIGLHSTEAEGLFELLDNDQSGYVSIEEFVSGCLRMKGGAKAVDMVSLLYENQKQGKKLNAIMKDVQRLTRFHA